MSTVEDIGRNMKFFDRLPQRVVGFGLYNDCELEEMVVFLNPSPEPITLHAFEELNVYIDGQRAGNTPLYTVNGDYTINPRSVMVMGKPYSKAETVGQ